MPSPSPLASSKSFMIPSPSEPGKIEMYSPQFYAACTVGGILSCSLTHMAVTPLDPVKYNMQRVFFMPLRPPITTGAVLGVEFLSLKNIAI